MSEWPLEQGDLGKRANVDTVRMVLQQKGNRVSSIAPNACVYEAIDQMARESIGALLVISDGSLLGVVTERDYARKVILKGRSSKDTPVSEIMTPDPITVSSCDTVDECLRIMTDRRVRHLPVVDEGELQGIVSIGDLVKAIISTQAHTIERLHAYIATEYPS